MADIKEGKLLYHLTDITNVPSILANGLLPRSKVNEFVDVADQEIIESRKKLSLEHYVPFHFFGGNPFDGRVQIDNAQKRFTLITVRRAVAEANKWKIIPKHPLANEELQLLDYEVGFSAIDWAKMNARDYDDPASKSTCMAECLAPSTVSTDKLFSFYVVNSEDQKEVRDALSQANLEKYVNITPALFVKK